MIKAFLALATTAAALSLTATQAQALSPRVWVSGHGVDIAGCGAPANPCRSLQFAHDNAVAAGGEIDILDPAGYGSLTITKAVSIVNDGVGTAGVQQVAAGQSAITVNADQNDSILLRGLNIEGLDVAKNGILVLSARRVDVSGCVIHGFATDGISYQPVSEPVILSVINSTIAHNEIDGVFILEANGTSNLPVVLDRDSIHDTSNGVAVASAHVTISNSAIFDTGQGVAANANSEAWLAKNVIVANNVGVLFNGGTVFSYGDNYFDDNQSGDTSFGSLSSIATK